MTILQSILKFIGGFTIAGGVIAGIYLGNIGDEFSVGVFLICVISAFISSIIYFALAKILDEIESINGSIWRINNSSNSKPPENASNSKLDLSRVSSGISGDSTWRCKNCGKINPSSSSICKQILMIPPPYYQRKR